jgi:hypothetical protein
MACPGGPSDGKSSQATSCLDMANLFVQVADDTLITGDAASNAEIGRMLAPIMKEKRC